MIYILKDNSFDRLAWKGINLSTIDELYDFIIDSDYRVRTLAAQIIQTKYATNNTFIKVCEMIDSNISTEREIAAYILGQLGTPKMPFAKKSIPLLYKLFNDNNDEVIESAISGLGHLWSYVGFVKNEEFFDKIIEFTRHQNPNIRISAVITLSSTENTEKVINAIEELLNNKNSEVREWAEIAKEILTSHVRSV